MSVGAFAVWYYGVIVRGPFASKDLARAAIADIRKRCTCDYRGLRIAAYEKEFDAQDPAGFYTHPSVLAMCGPKKS